MGAQLMLEQMLRSGLSLLDGKAGGAVTPAAGQSDAGWGRFGAGAATGGVLGLLLGSQGGRRLGGKALKYGSVAALGVVAFRAYSNWQAQQAQQAPQHPSSAAAGAAPTPQTVNLLPAPEAELHSRAIVQAMIAAAKADGHMDERERGLVEAKLSQLEPDATVRAWFEEELRRPLDPAQVAKAATSPGLAAEIYLASLLVTDDTVFMERAYLDELARQLRLADGLKVELEHQSRAA